MALHSFAAAVLVVVVVLVSCLLAPPAVEAVIVDISTYWGTNATEGSLEEACNTGWYSVVNIGFVDKFGHHRTPNINLDGHCGPPEGCEFVGAQIQACQKLGIKVLISIGGPDGDYNLTSDKDATDVANYLWDAYLGGNQLGVIRPFGDDAILDGVDFFIEGGTTLYWDVLAEALKNLSNNGTQMELSATPKCQYPDHYLGDAIDKGLFDYVQVRFYNETGCEYNNGSFHGMKTAWDKWTAAPGVTKIFLGVTASKEEGGYVDPEVLVDGFLLDAMDSPKFGALMVWNRYTDGISKYSESIKNDYFAIQTAPSGVEVE